MWTLRKLNLHTDAVYASALLETGSQQLEEALRGDFSSETLTKLT